jgi:hypothetical protein
MKYPVLPCDSVWLVFRKNDLSGLRRFRQVAGEAFQLGLVMYDGSKTLPLGDGFRAVPIGILWDVKGRPKS